MLKISELQLCSDQTTWLSLCESKYNFHLPIISETIGNFETYETSSESHDTQVGITSQKNQEHSYITKLPLPSTWQKLYMYVFSQVGMVSLHFSHTLQSSKRAFIRGCIICLKISSISFGKVGLCLLFL